MTPPAISAAFPFEPHFADVHGSRLHYVDEGEGDPVLFLHGNPTSSYLWRNVIPHVTPHGRCIALDLIGFGRSDKPEIGYRLVDHVRYVEGFIEALDLRNITLVLHDWGSALGLHYAMRHESNVRGLALMEAILGPVRWNEVPARYRLGFRLLRAPGAGWLVVVALNAFVTTLLPKAIVRTLTDEEKRRYREPFPTLASRKPIRVWPREIPFDGKPSDVHALVESYSRALPASPLPKILFHATPGGIIRERELRRARESLPNLTTIDIGPGIHFLQEDNPHLIGTELARWLGTL